MFLLFPPASFLSKQESIKFTFQYVSIISLQKKKKCFYDYYLHSNMFLLFLLSVVTLIKRLLPLHSNMFLLFHDRESIQRGTQDFTFQYVSIISDVQPPSIINNYELYIPICFYYFQDRRAEIQRGAGLYIPICFYYFEPKHEPYYLCYSFTFQYVSIISRPI